MPYPPRDWGSEPRGRCRRSHHNRTKASRNSTATPSWLNSRCNQSKEVKDPLSSRYPRTSDHSGPDNPGNAAAISA
jgi:hypothetical protein